MRFLDKDVNDFVSLNKLDCFVDSQLILETDQAIYLKG
jgi:hypothetical protein